MKKIFFPLLISLSPVFLSAQSSSYHFTPEHPAAGQTIILDLDANVSLQQIVPVTMDGQLRFFKLSDAQTDGKPGRYSLTVPDTTAGYILITHTGGAGQPDRMTPVFIYEQDGKTTKKGASLAMASSTEQAKDFFHMGNADSMGLAWMEQEFRYWPENKRPNLSNYLYILASAKGKKAEAQIMQELDGLSRQSTPSDEDAYLLYTFYTLYGQTTRAEKLAPLLLDKYSDARVDLVQHKIGAFRNGSFEQQLEDFNTMRKYESAEMVYHVAVSNALLKDDFTTVKTILDGKTKNIGARTWYSAALFIATKGNDAATAERYVQNARKVAAEAFNKGGEENARAIRFNVGKSYEVTGVVLSYERRYAEALPYYDSAKKYAPPFPMLDIEDYYLEAVAHSARYGDVKARLEERIKTGKESPAVKDALKAVYNQESGHQASGFDGYLANLETQRNDSLVLHVKNSMVDLPAPDFTLEDMNGNKVNLASLKGKIVVVDFWATWCGPCIASFPAMKQMIQKYKGDNDVVFLFIDTWEGLPNPQPKVSNFLKGKDLPFTVLLDKDDKVITSYGVKGIPTKFVIDKNGKTRYDVTGYPPGQDAMVAELSAMIEMARKG